MSFRVFINVGDDIAATSDVITLNYFRSEKESMLSNYYAMCYYAMR